MMQCESCGAPAILKMLFCPNCGAALSIEAERSSAGAWNTIHFIIEGSGRRQKLALSSSEPLLIGRADPDNSYWPQLDLTDEGALALGVSRYHALIKPTGETAVLIDRGSTNGSWLDDLRLEPELPYLLPASGRMRFGSLSIYFFLE